jgi:hypothetical protein
MNVGFSNRNGKYGRTVLSKHSIEVALGLQYAVMIKTRFPSGFYH